MLIIQKLPTMGPEMKGALRSHILRKRQRLKQELEQDAIERRMKIEKEQKRIQDAMTLDQIKEQLCVLEKRLETLKNEKHILFVQLKQVLSEDNSRRKRDECSSNQKAQQQHQSHHQTNPRIDTKPFKSDSSAPSSSATASPLNPATSSSLYANSSNSRPNEPQQITIVGQSYVRRKPLDAPGALNLGNTNFNLSVLGSNISSPPKVSKTQRVAPPQDHLLPHFQHLSQNGVLPIPLTSLARFPTPGFSVPYSDASNYTLAHNQSLKNPNLANLHAQFMNTAASGVSSEMLAHQVNLQNQMRMNLNQRLPLGATDPANFGMPFGVFHPDPTRLPPASPGKRSYGMAGLNHGSPDDRTSSRKKLNQNHMSIHQNIPPSLFNVMDSFPLSLPSNLAHLNLLNRPGSQSPSISAPINSSQANADLITQSMNSRKSLAGPNLAANVDYMNLSSQVKSGHLPPGLGHLYAQQGPMPLIATNNPYQNIEEELKRFGPIYPSVSQSTMVDLPIYANHRQVTHQEQAALISADIQRRSNSRNFYHPNK